MIFRVCSPEKVGPFQELWTIGELVTDMDKVLTLKHCYSCGCVHLCPAASAPLLLFTVVLKAVSLKVIITSNVEAIDQHQLGQNHFWGKSS
jgi:hypothetical protein